MGCTQSKVNEPKICEPNDVEKKNEENNVNEKKNETTQPSPVTRKELDVKPPPVKAIPKIVPKAIPKKGA
ncbi:conserved Plasmodium protein, unknown function [Plasmodium gallinaceum]|uniref:Uncharacterized protein n=1 Tax=Plasmodium gallinaceum TaxID=5849 RepID=A0A1J1GW43_PLAGA|nr:conserved Plasmodium protein, unknown function [Plasmodium gallinaceum]CRG96686.1 conserved Plasmodium protein, unknown function [Plasmodium gallinaceum]